MLYPRLERSLSSPAMHACTLDARGKINLYLGILGERPDGFHEVAMVLQSIDLADHLQLSPAPLSIELRCDHPQIPTDETNLAHRAAALLKSEFGRLEGVKIEIQKRIPVAAGLAGGSTDAAAVLVGLNQMWELGLTVTDLQSLAARLGSDIPFCISGGTQLATGRGEILEPLNDLDQVPVLLAKHRQISVSTAWAYQAYRHLQRPPQPPAALREMLTALSHRDPQQIANHIHNDLELPVLEEHPAVAELKALIDRSGALGTMMSGSGPSVFGIYDSPERARSSCQHLNSTHSEIEFWATRTAPTGITMELG